VTRQDNTNNNNNNNNFPKLYCCIKHL
jgi:hypothetical protein